MQRLYTGDNSKKSPSWVGIFFDELIVGGCLGVDWR